ncbi:hypothetical protein GGQ84_002523 [Desulfitispora alkaliphila]|uniref:permease n=1 Tax=Desulfitispora alkaliphila TaxID=622674 RepID=UPI003D232909
MGEWKKLLYYMGIFLAFFFIPFDSAAVEQAILEAFKMGSEYAREHVILCLIPALFIAGAITNFISQNAVLKYFGSQAKKYVSYSVASVSGVVLSVCSCTVLPLFAGIYTRGAGLGPAVAFLYAGPAINVLAIILTARVLGWEFGVARAVGAIIFAIVIGLVMHYLFRKEEEDRENADFDMGGENDTGRTGMQNAIYFTVLVFILIFAAQEYFVLALPLFLALAYMIVRWFTKDELKDWVNSTWEFTQLILPLLVVGVLLAGFLMGRPGTDAGIIPAPWIEGLVGGNSLSANVIASLLGAVMYFATLTEVPIIQGLVGSGMGNGPAMALLLAGPALSLPNMLVIRSVLGNKKTAVYILLVVIMSTIVGLIFGAIMG